VQDHEYRLRAPFSHTFDDGRVVRIRKGQRDHGAVLAPLCSDKHCILELKDIARPDVP
jgi:hypothetical protein